MSDECVQSVQQLGIICVHQGVQQLGNTGGHNLVCAIDVDETQLCTIESGDVRRPMRPPGPGIGKPMYDDECDKKGGRQRVSTDLVLISVISVSNLSFLSKLLERAVHSWLQAFLYSAKPTH